ncbi:hypothetical protein ZWY2020_050217 [Hordeum vulgare]|nr:hypothetical protein ZWY2020_050217 [Hordeum vulgare]
MNRFAAAPYMSEQPVTHSVTHVSLAVSLQVWHVGKKKDAGLQTPVHDAFSMQGRQVPVQEHASVQSALQSTCPMADGPMDDRTSTTQRATAAVLSAEAIGVCVELA